MQERKANTNKMATVSAKTYRVHTPTHVCTHPPTYIHIYIMIGRCVGTHISFELDMVIPILCKV